MRSMCDTQGVARELKLFICQNRLERGNSDIAAAIRSSLTPAHLTMRMVEYEKERGFRQLLEAVRHNTTLKSLDISKASLPSEQAEDETCDTLQRMFEENTTLEELDISGEHAHLEDSRFGIGLNHALTGLRKNTALRVLRLEYQNLDVQGADTLCSVILGNDTLTHIYCEHNNVSLQGYTGIVNALERNFSILYMPSMEADKSDSIKGMRGRISEARTVVTKGAASTTKTAAKKMTGLMGMGHKEKNLMPTVQDVESSVGIYEEGWKVQQRKMERILLRNYNLAQGLISRQEAEGMMTEWQGTRPGSAMTEHGFILQAMKHTTPKMELPNPVDMHIEGMGEAGRTTPMQGDGNRRDYMSPIEHVMSPQDKTPRQTDYRRVSGGWVAEGVEFKEMSPPPRRRERGFSELTATMARFELGGEDSAQHRVQLQDEGGPRLQDGYQGNGNGRAWDENTQQGHPTYR